MSKSVACLNFEHMRRVLRSTATAVELQLSIRHQWKEMETGLVLGAAYKVMFWKEPPGTVEVNIASVRELSGRIAKRTDDLTAAFLRNLATGGMQAAVAYANDIERIRANAIAGINEAFDDARRINAEIAGQLQTAGRRAAHVKLVSTGLFAVLSGGSGVMAVAGMSSIGGIALGGTGLQFFAVGFTNAMAMSVAKNANQANTANAVAIDFGKEVRKTAIQEGLNHGAAAAQAGAGAILSDHRTKARFAQEAAKYAEWLGREAKRTARQQKNWARRGAAAGAKADAIKPLLSQGNAQLLKSSAKGMSYGLPVVFTALDLKSSYDDWVTDLKALD